jgi:hypothetical protein
MATRFWTSTDAMSMSRVMSKTTLMLQVPSLALVEVTYFIPSTPLIWRSRGAVTADSTSSALAPVKTVDTLTCGGLSSG